MANDVEDTPLFAELAGDDAEHMLALIADPTPPPSSQDLLAQYPGAT